jgi:hypothetical protein
MQRGGTSGGGAAWRSAATGRNKKRSANEQKAEGHQLQGKA